VALPSSGRQTGSGHFLGGGGLVWVRCWGCLGAGHITNAIEKDRPPQRFICG